MKTHIGQRPKNNDTVPRQAFCGRTKSSTGTMLDVSEYSQEEDYTHPYWCKRCAKIAIQKQQEED